MAPPVSVRVVVVSLVAYGAVAPFASIPLPRIDSFIPTLTAIVFVTDLVTAVLLFGQFSTTGSRALLVLASGYLFSSLIVIPFTLTFPGAFAPTGLLGAGSQSAAYLMFYGDSAFPRLCWVCPPGFWHAHETCDRALAATCNFLERGNRNHCGVCADLGRYRRR